tara:strand:+ start:1686 stop:2291 length:606 start_codon:yes stop_codon:yes gene_type:complete
MEYRLQLNFLSDWQISEGKDAQIYANNMVQKDAQGLPFVSGKTLKGALRQAFTLAETNAWFPAEQNDIVNVLFGRGDRDALESQALLWLGRAQLAANEQAFFAQPEQRKYLYHTTSMMKMDAKTGTTAEGSLRTEEVTIPVTLYATLGFNTDHPYYLEHQALLDAHFRTWLSQCLPLIRTLGGKTNRGLGQLQLELMPDDR